MEPRIITTSSIFKKVYVDTFRMPKSTGTPNKNGKTSKLDLTAEELKYLGYNAVIVIQCGFSGWSEARVLKEKTTEILGD